MATSSNEWLEQARRRYWQRIARLEGRTDQPVAAEDLAEVYRVGMQAPYGTAARARAEAIRGELVRLEGIRWRQRGGPIVRGPY